VLSFDDNGIRPSTNRSVPSVTVVDNLPGFTPLGSVVGVYGAVIATGAPPFPAAAAAGSAGVALGKCCLLMTMVLDQVPTVLYHQ
jgi:ABC-type uncharacterized transport system permease subunit